MECHSCDSKKLTKVFDASLRKRSKKIRDGFDDTNSVATDDSALGCLQTSCRVPSEKASLPDMSTAQTTQQDIHVSKRDSSPSQAHSPVAVHRSPARSRRKHRRPVNEGISLALKAGLVSTPRTISPNQERDGVAESIPQDQDSFIYAFLEEAIKRDKKKQRQARRKEERRTSRDREASVQRERDHDRERTRERVHDHDRERTRERGRDRDCDPDHHRHHHRHREELPSRDHDRHTKDLTSVDPTTVNQTLLFETFAKMCAQISEKDSHKQPHLSPMRSHSHKSLQCEVLPKKESYVVDRQPVRLNSQTKSRDLVANKIRSQENCSTRVHSREKLYMPNDIDRPKQEKYIYYYDKDVPKYSNKMDMCRSRMRQCDEERYRDYPPMLAPTRSYIDPYRRPGESRHYRDLDRDTGRHYDDDKRKYCEQKTSRSFEVHREYIEDERVRRTARSDPKDRRYEERDKRYNDVPKYFDDKPIESRDRINNLASRDRRWRKNLERFDRNSITSRDDDREQDRYSEKERDSGLSVADGDISTVSGRSNCLKVVKQQISEQRDAMDKMMKLWKELMRCFKSIAQGQGQDKNVRESAANVQESAAEQMRLWWECMRRYETVARDVGDTDARLMEEIKKQRSEMAEMATMWQECLQRYRDISNDFNSLKQQLVTPESPTRMPAPPLLCPAEGEGSVATAAYRLPPAYPPQVATVAGMPNGGMHTGALPPASMVGGYPRTGSPLHGRSSAPPAWWYCDAPNRSPRRRSSPDSRASRERDKDRRHRHKDREDTRYKEKSSKPSAARSEHRHRKR